MTLLMPSSDFKRSSKGLTLTGSVAVAHSVESLGYKQVANRQNPVLVSYLCLKNNWKRIDLP